MAAERGALPSSVVIMRHGRREDSMNPAWALTSKHPWDTPLVFPDSETGEAAAALAGVAFDVCYTSPFLRCLQTAQRLLKAMQCQGIPVHVHKGLSEVHAPHLMVRLRTFTLGHRLRIWRWRASYARHSRPTRHSFAPKARVLEEGDWPPLPESESQAGVRLYTTMQQLAARHPGQRVLLVTHGKAVQVAWEALGPKDRLVQVGFGGFFVARPKGAQPDSAPQQTDKGGGALGQVEGKGHGENGRPDHGEQAREQAGAGGVAADEGQRLEGAAASAVEGLTGRPDAAAQPASTAQPPPSPSAAAAQAQPAGGATGSTESALHAAARWWAALEVDPRVGPYNLDVQPPAEWQL